MNKIIANDTSPINSSETRKKKNQREKPSPSSTGKNSPSKKKTLTNTTAPNGTSGKYTTLDRNEAMLQASSSSSSSSILPTYSSPQRKKVSPAKQAKAAALATTLSSEIPLVQHLTMVNNHRIGYVPFSRIEKSSPEKTAYPSDDIENSPTRSSRSHGLTPPTRYRPYEGLEGSTGSPTRSRSPYSPSRLSPSPSSGLNTSINMDDSKDISRQIDDKMSDVGKAISSLQVWIFVYHDCAYILYYKKPDFFKL